MIAAAINGVLSIAGFLLDGALFILVGLTLHTFNAASGAPILRLVLTGVCVAGGIAVIRLIWSRSSPHWNPYDGCGTMLNRRDQLLLGWSGNAWRGDPRRYPGCSRRNPCGVALAGRDDVI